MNTNLALAIAIVSEVLATAALRESHGFTRLLPTGIVVLGYGTAFYFLSIALRSMPVGIAYAVWSGAGIVLISAIGWFIFGQKLDWPAIFGIALILTGVLVINVWSSSGH